VRLARRAKSDREYQHGLVAAALQANLHCGIAGPGKEHRAPIYPDVPVLDGLDPGKIRLRAQVYQRIVDGPMVFAADDDDDLVVAGARGTGPNLDRDVKVSPTLCADLRVPRIGPATGQQAQ